MVGGHSGCWRVYDPLKQCVATAGVNDSHVRDSVCVILPVEDGNTLLGTTSTLAFHDTIISTECPAIFAVHKATHFAMYDTNLVPMKRLFWQEQSRPKVAKSVSPPSSSPPAAVIGVKTVDDGVKNGASDEELDELDAKEAAQFKADVQGHRHHEVSFVILFGPMRCSVFTFYSIPL